MSGLHIDAVRRTSADPGALASFYERAFGFVPVFEDEGHYRLTLGEQHLELVPAEEDLWTVEAAPSNSPGFQHIAIIVSDMDAAMTQLRSVPGWTAISTAGAEHLPAASGGVWAFKFRDPEGHPVELLQFPPHGVPTEWQRGSRLFLGIDHTAITVADTARSLAFYEALGFEVLTQQVNRGAEQARMDGVEGAVVEVTGLRLPGAPTPHLELLCYLEPGTIALSRTGGSAIVLAGWVNGEFPPTDPDGHRLVAAGLSRAGEYR